MLSEVDLIESFVGFRLASGCRLGRNTFALLPYTFKDCCEATYRADHAGCIVGGQFNGRPFDVSIPTHLAFLFLNAFKTSQPHSQHVQVEILEASLARAGSRC